MIAKRIFLPALVSLSLLTPVWVGSSAAQESIRFQDAGDYAEVPHDSTLAPERITVELWLRVHDLGDTSQAGAGGEQTFLDKRWNGGGYSFRLAGTKIPLALGGIAEPTMVMPGLTGRLYIQFAATISIATLLSSLNALTLSPALCALLLKPASEKKREWRIFTLYNRAFDWTTNKYLGVVGFMLRRMGLMTLAFLGMVVLMGVGFSRMPTGFVPGEDEGYFFVNAELPPGASLERTRAGVFKGKWPYMSPEQIEGRRLDARADLFALGAVLWELLAARALFFRGGKFQTFSAIMDEPIPPISAVRADVPAKLCEVVGRALARDREARYENAARFRAALVHAGREVGKPLTGGEIGRGIRAALAPGDAPPTWPLAHGVADIRSVVSRLPLPPPATGAWESDTIPDETTGKHSALVSRLY